MKPTWKQYALWIGLTEVVGGVSALLSREGMKLYEFTVTQPPLAPPMWLFPVVWTILYALMGISAARIAQTASRQGLNLFIIQLIVNFFWPLLFFNAHSFGFAAIWLGLLWVLVLLMILRFRRADPTAAILQIPYLLWLTFALYLNLSVWRLNP